MSVDLRVQDWTHWEIFLHHRSFAGLTVEDYPAASKAPQRDRFLRCKSSVHLYTFSSLELHHSIHNPITDNKIKWRKTLDSQIYELGQQWAWKTRQKNRKTKNVESIGNLWRRNRGIWSLKMLKTSWLKPSTIGWVFQEVVGVLPLVVRRRRSRSLPSYCIHFSFTLYLPNRNRNSITESRSLLLPTSRKYQSAESLDLFSIFFYRNQWFDNRISFALRIECVSEWYQTNRRSD